MKIQQVLKIGYFVPDKSYMNFTEKFFAYLTRKTNIDGRITTALVDFLIKHSKEFDKASFILTNTHSVLTEYINQT